MVVQTSVLESSIRASLDRSLDDLRATLGFEAGSVLEVGAFEVVEGFDQLSELGQLYDLMTTVWVDFSGESTGRLILAQTGDSAGLLMKELEEHCAGFASAEEAWFDILGEIGNNVLNTVIKGFVADFGVKLRAAIPEVRDTSVFQVCAEGLSAIPGDDALIVDANLRIDGIGFDAKVWTVLDPEIFAG